MQNLLAGSSPGVYYRVCPTDRSRQSGREPGARKAVVYGADTHWRDVPIEELRDFMRELVMETSLRAAARMIGRGHEMVRKFVDGAIDRPQDRTRRAMAEVFLARQKLVRQVSTNPSTPTAGRLSLVLPKGTDAATREIRNIFELIRGSEKAPRSADVLEGWLVRRIEEEYATEVRYSGAKKPRRKKAAKESPGT
jgi:hypothetical protein